MMEDLKAAGMEHLYETIEMPLVFTLADMEHTGIAIDAANLKEYGEKLAVGLQSWKPGFIRKQGKSLISILQNS